MKIKSRFRYGLGEEAVRNKFNFLWKEYYSMTPPLDKMDGPLRDKLKEFTRKIFEDQYISSYFWPTESDDSDI